MLCYNGRTKQNSRIGQKSCFDRTAIGNHTKQSSHSHRKRYQQHKKIFLMGSWRRFCSIAGHYWQFNLHAVMPIKTRPHSLTRHKYQNNWQKFTQKRAKVTIDEFHANHNVCEVCGNNHFLAEKQLEIKQPHYRMWGYQSKRINWRIRCATKNCGEPFAVILKPEYWDSVDS